MSELAARPRVGPLLLAAGYAPAFAQFFPADDATARFLRAWSERA